MLRIEHEVKGKTKVFFLGTTEPDALVAAIERGRSAVTPRVRVEDEAVLAEAEEDAAKEAERASRRAKAREDGGGFVT